jgi:hypothetical protein
MFREISLGHFGNAPLPLRTPLLELVKWIYSLEVQNTTYISLSYHPKQLCKARSP